MKTGPGEAAAPLAIMAQGLTDPTTMKEAELLEAGVSVVVEVVAVVVVVVVVVVKATTAEAEAEATGM